MSALLTISRVFIFFILFLQIFAGSLNGIMDDAAELPPLVRYDLASEDEIKSKVSRLETLQAPDALLSPIPSYQFSFTEILYCFLFLIFSFFAITKTDEIAPFFTRSYFRTLFSSLILINAP